MRNKKQAQGFTLIELLIVIAIIGILAAVLIPNLLSARARANDTATQAYARSCVTAVEAERNPQTGALPASGACDGASLGDSAVVAPNAVTGSVYTNNGDDTYTVVATSVTGATWTYNGTEWVYAE